MHTSELLLYRLNIVDTSNLFQNLALRADQDVLDVLSHATEEAHDTETRTRAALYRWSLRNFYTSTIEGDSRVYAIGTFARSTISKRGKSVTSSSIETVNSESSPPLAQDTLIVVDLKRHIVAVEYSSLLMQSEVWRKQLEKIVSQTAGDRGFTSYVRLEAINLPERLNEEISSFERVTRVAVTLAIPNPDIGPTFERLHEEMTRGGIRELKQDMSNPNGMNVSGDSLPRASIDMALSGYREGKLVVDGVRDGEVATITIGETDDEVARVKVEGLREYAAGVRDGTKDPTVKKVMRSLLKKMDDLLA
jgi:hypothetical protein